MTMAKSMDKNDYNVNEEKPINECNSMPYISASNLQRMKIDLVRFAEIQSSLRSSRCKPKGNQLDTRYIWFG